VYYAAEQSKDDLGLAGWEEKNGCNCIGKESLNNYYAVNFLNKKKCRRG
jgi:hypothetical protein